MAFVNQLKLDRDPFARDRGSPLGPVRAAFEELMRHIERKAAMVMVVGPAGSGKSFLLDITEQACRQGGMTVLRIERGDLAHTVIGQCVDLLLVDEADFLDETSLEFIGRHRETPKTIVFACRTPRFMGDVAASIVKLAPLTPNEAREFVLERATTAGRPDLFAPEALDFLVAGTSGLPRLLRSVGALALFIAAQEGARRASADHVAQALAAQNGRAQSSAKKSDLNRRDAVVSLPSARRTEEPAPRREAARSVADAPENASKPLVPKIAPSEGTNSRRSFGKAKIFAALIIPLLMLNGSLGEAARWSAKSYLPPRHPPTDALLALEGVAKAAYPGPVILVIALPSLQSPPIAAAERRPVIAKRPVTSAPRRLPIRGTNTAGRTQDTSGTQSEWR